MKEIILRDAKMCAYAAGNVEHFKYLMKRLGYVFKKDAWMEVQAPGFRYYHKLAKLDEMFSEETLRHHVDMPWMAKPYFYSSDIRGLHRAKLSSFQKKFYAKLYRLRIVEQKRFAVGGAKYAEDLKRFHQLQDEYLLLVNNDIKSIVELVDFISEKEDRIQQIADRQKEIYRESSSRKRSIKNEEQYREYQIWHVEVQEELDELKQEKREIKRQLQLADGIVKEDLYTVYYAVSGKEEIVADRDVEIPGMEEQVACKGLTDEVDTVEVERADDMYGDDLEYARENSYNKVYSDVAVQECRGDDGKEAYESYTEAVYSSKAKSIVSMDKLPVETITESNSFYSYEEYIVSPDEERIQIVDINGNDDVMEVYEKLSSFFKQIGHKADFDELYEEAKRLVDVVRKSVVEDKANKVAKELLACGPYKYLKTSVKADAFKFDVSDAGGNLKLFMSVLDKLGVELDGDQLYEEYQKIYDEIVSRNEMNEMEQEKQWNKGRGR